MKQAAQQAQHCSPPFGSLGVHQTEALQGASPPGAALAACCPPAAMRLTASTMPCDCRRCLCCDTVPPHMQGTPWGERWPPWQPLTLPEPCSLLTQPASTRSSATPLGLPGQVSFCTSACATWARFASAWPLVSTTQLPVKLQGVASCCRLETLTLATPRASLTWPRWRALQGTMHLPRNTTVSCQIPGASSMIRQA